MLRCSVLASKESSVVQTIHRGQYFFYTQKPPEKTNLTYDIPQARLDKLSPEKAATILQIKKIFEEETFRWSDFPIELPPSKLQHSGPSLSDIFSRKSVTQELLELSRNADGSRKRLSPEQLQEIRQTGKFTVQSLYYAGLDHLWKLSPLFLKGKENISDQKQQTYLKALEHIVMGIPNRFRQQSWIDVGEGWKALKEGLWDFPQLFFGQKTEKRKYNDLFRILDKERKSFIEDSLEPLAPGSTIYKIKGLNKPDADNPEADTAEKVIITESGEVKFTHNFTIDFKLASLLSNIEIVRQIRTMEKEVIATWERSRGRVRKYLLRSYKRTGVPDEEIPQRLADDLVTEYNKRLLTMIKNSRRLAAYDPLLGPYFADKLKTILIIRDFSEEQKKEEARYKQHLTDELKKKYPVRSKIKSWLAHHTKVQLQAYIDKQKHGSLAFVTVYPIAGINHEELIKKLVDEGLIEQAYLINKSVEFIPQAVALMKKLDKEKVPLKYFEFEARIWNPKHWTVTTLIKKGKSEKIIERYEKIKTNTGHFGWRFSNMWARTQKFFKDGIYLIAITNLWNGPLSLQALFTKQQFYPHYTLKDGLVEYNIDRPVQSYLSLLRSIKDRIKKARDDFENSVEGTFVDRDIIRPFHIVWTYLKYYSLGLAVLTLFPPAVIVNFLLSTSLILSSPLWSPLLAFSIYLTSVTVYDFDAIESHAQNLGLPIMKPLIYTFAMGIGQILLSFVGVLLYHPVMCLWLCNWAFWRKNLKSISDFLVFYVFIKRYVRVPAKNSLLAERIAGPGLESTFLYKIPVELSLLLLQEHIEKFEIKQYKEILIEKIDEPEAKYRKVHFELFSHFGTTLGSHPNLERILDDEESLQKSIDESIKAQEEKNPVRGIELPSNVRLSAKDLPKMLHFSKHLVEEFFTERVFKLMSEKQIAQFWEDYGLEKNDWENLTIEFIEEIFTEAFLEPLKEGDVVYELDNRKEEVEMLAKQIFKGIPELENYTSAREHAVVPTVKSRYQNLHVENGLYPPRLPSSISPWIISKKK